MNYSELQEEITSTLDRMEENSKRWPIARAEYDKMQDMKKITLNVIADGIDAKTSAEKDRKAYKSKKYLDYINKCFDVSIEHYAAQAEKEFLHDKLEALRS